MPQQSYNCLNCDKVFYSYAKNRIFCSISCKSNYTKKDIPPLYKRCWACKQIKPFNDFYKNKSTNDGYQATCRACALIQSKKYYWQHRDIRQTYNKKWRMEHVTERKIYKLELRQKERLKVLQIISGLKKPICVNCGCDDVRFLEINHINGGGTKEFKQIGSYRLGNQILLGKRGIDDLNVLCRVCNALFYLKLKFGNIPINIQWLGESKS